MLLVVRPGAPSSVLAPVVRPGAPSSFLLLVVPRAPGCEAISACEKCGQWGEALRLMDGLKERGLSGDLSGALVPIVHNISTRNRYDDLKPTGKV